MWLYIRRKDLVFCWQMEAATLSTITQVAIYVISKHLGWF